ncbi:MAG: hypothetical protein J6J71_04710 [Prevotella sp.]|nr:hypothetical protein [Prevotella sp.]
MSKQNFRQIFTRKEENQRKIFALCPKAVHRSGIYVFHRVNEQGFKFAYIGLATKSLLSRLADHLEGYSQHIDLSIRKYGLYDEIKNPYGYKIDILCYCPQSECNDKEQYYIKKFADEGWQLQNTTGGSQGKGKFGLNENKSGKTYREGVAFGKKSLARELRHIIETHGFTIEPSKRNKITEKALARFWELLREDNENEEKGT